VIQQDFQFATKGVKDEVSAGVREAR